MLVEDAAALERAAAELREETLVGFDTETRPAFRPGERYLPSLFQAAAKSTVFIFPVQRFDCSALLRRLLSSPGTVKAGISVADDLKTLKELFPFDEASVVDVGRVAKKAGAKQSGVRNLAGLCLGFRIPKRKSTSNWAAPRLSPQQLLYAATDAWACRELALHFARLGLL
ncbi:MAG: 3'-5' exonuclease domain-containing protein 2 [Betaproteobacteria bacterium]|nr:3'-5' exonuclease domain-containing protein 2 [Betaproteobacteria bacterium]